MKECQDYFALSIHPILSNTMSSNLNGMLRTRNYDLFWHQHLTRRNMHSLTHSLTAGGGLFPAWSPSWAGTEGFICLLSPTPLSSPPVQGDPLCEPRAQLPQEGTGRRQATALLVAGGDTAAPPVWGPVGSHLSGAGAGRQYGSPARLCPRAATLPHSPRTPDQASNPRLIQRQNKQKFVFLCRGCLITGLILAMQRHHFFLPHVPDSGDHAMTRAPSM